MNKIYYVISLTLFLFITLSSTAQTNYSEQITVRDSINKQNNDLVVNLDVILDKLQIKSDHMIVLTPVIRSQDQLKSKELPKIVITGNRKDRSLRRSLLISKKDVFNGEPYSIVNRKNKTTQTVNYSTSVPAEDWMKNGSLILQENVSGCAFCELVNSENLLMSPILKETFIPRYKTNFISPDVEKIKARNEVSELYLSFKIGSWVIDMPLGNNTNEIKKFDDLYNTVLKNDDLTITNINIVGFSSPDGSFDVNMRLSERRAKATAEFLEKRHNISNNLISVDWKGEDWDGLTKILETADIAGKDKVLEIIRKTNIHDGRESEIMKLEGGNVYRQLLNEVFPGLRRITCTINYQVASFDVEKAKEAFVSSPKLLSLNEIYLLANSYPKGSAESENIYLKAVQIFPNNPLTAVNAAGIEIEHGNIEEAMQIIEKVKNDPIAWNNLGIIMAENKRYDEAKEYFMKASQNGVSEATDNLSQINKFLDE
ncbi:DUF3868 domain-containing protein [Dysgonomonas sp. ZJ279]|uniref:DUF3868 domain-containing protein n=1 Tax=Dysgonomonas sp. ZJ279 TaxID=2709796 RepID=UPI0013EA1CC5|nr:DUF3868 domain-containing protein [Dysgonomonas sp. ZJ279]